MYVPWLAFSTGPVLGSTTATKACAANAATTKLARRDLPVLRASMAAAAGNCSVLTPLLLSGSAALRTVEWWCGWSEMSRQRVGINNGSRSYQTGAMEN